MAIAVVAIVSGPLLQTFVTSAKVGQRSYDIDKANAATVQVIEELKGYSLTDLTGAGSQFTQDGEGKYRRTLYYDAAWKGPYSVNSEEGYPFRVDLSLSSQASSQVEQSYVARLGAGEGYYLVADYKYMTPGQSYTLRAQEKSGGDYSVSSDNAILRKSSDGSTLNQTLSLPGGDVGDILPILVDVSGPAEKKVTLTVNNQTGKEVVLYLYGDLDASHVTTALSADTLGNMSVSRMSVSSETLEFNKLTLSAQVVRTEDGQKLTDYTTMLYFAG